MRLNTAILISLAALTISCSKNSSVEDDWPGIDEIKLDKTTEDPQSLSFVGPLTLQSKLGIPSMGKDVSFDLYTTCYRDTPEGSDKQAEYKKRLHYSAGLFEPVAELPTSEFLPPETLIFPEFFKSCDITLTAVNSIGSTQTSELKGLKFEFSEDKDRKLILHENDDVYDEHLVIKGSDLKQLTFSLISKSDFKNSKFFCFTDKKIQEISLNDKKLKEVSSAHLLEIEFHNSSFVSSCVLTAVNIEQETISSKRFQVIDKYADKYTTVASNRIQDIVTPHKQIFYEDKSEVEKQSILSLVVTAPKSRNLNFKFKNTYNQSFHSKVITGTQETSFETNFGDDQYTYRKVLDPQRYKIYWSQHDKMIESQGFNIPMRQSEYYTLHIAPSYNCSNPRSANQPAELGFIIDLPKSHPIFDVEVYAENDFTTFMVDEFNLLDKYKQPVTTNMYETANPLEMRAFEQNYSSSFLKLIYRNNNIQPGVPLRLHHTQMSMNPTDDSHTFGGAMSQPPKRYPFRAYNSEFAKQTTCETTL